MAKDKPSKSAASAPEAKTEEKKPIARGHRQRGAGTVITARPAVVTNDGITLKPHERLPTQLLNEYCQKEKRPKPRFIPTPPHNRLTVVLEDTKNSKNDLSFTPVQTKFESDTVARDFASLLALFHFQKALPLERKLPEPYCTTWVEMVNASKPAPSGAASAKAAAKPSAAPAPPAVAMEKVAVAVKPPAAPVEEDSKNYKNKGAKNNAKSEPAAQPSAGDQWLCDNCGSVNFATTLAGQARTKCFKCQSPKPEGASTISKASLDVKKNKAAPKAVLDLRAKNTFASQAASEQQDLAERAERNRRLTFFDALKRANRPKAIHLKPAIRDALEQLFGIEHSPDAPCSIRGLSEYLEDVREEGIVPLDVCSVSCADQAAILQTVCADLSDQGRSDTAIVHAVKNAIFKRNDELVEDFAVRFENAEVLEDDPRSIVEKASAILDTLLRDTLQNTVSAKLTVVPTASAKTATAQRVSESLNLCEDAVRELESLGWRQDTTLLNTLQLVENHSLFANMQRRDAEDMSWLFPLFIHTLALTSAAEKKLSLVSFLQALAVNDAQSLAEDAEMDTLNASLAEEKEALESILGDKFRAHQFAVGALRGVSLSISDVELSETLKFPHTINVEILFRQGLRYPDESPLVLLRNAEEKRTDARLIALNVLVQNAVLALRGAHVVFAVYSLLMDLASTDDIFAILHKMRFSRVVFDALLALCEESELSEDRIEESLSVLTVLAAEDVVEDDDEDAASAAATDNETTATSISSKSQRKHHRVHPFWSKARPGSTAVPTKNAKYLEMFRQRESLPSFAKRDEFLQLLPQNQVVIVTGETGCGKTTQMPQFIHESNADVKILICQPRRLAAIGVAARVAEEQATTIGDRVGYMVKGDSKVSGNTRIMFCTYGVLLRRLQDDPSISGVDYVVFDEVHERGIDSDFCLALLMDALERRSSLKLILMSATISTDHFRAYAKRELRLVDVPPLLHIPGYTFPVTEFYKSDFEQIVRAYTVSSAMNHIGGRPNPNKRKDVDYDLLLKLVFYLIRGDAPANPALPEMFRAATGCILIFLPGVPEINRFLDFFRQFWNASSSHAASPHVNLIALHGNVSPIEQRKVFQPAPRGTIKIVAATNVAEASVTIPDVTVVVDTCRVKEMGYDPETQAFALTLKFAARDSLRQRKGRAGRVQEGRCFRLITNNTFEKLPAHSVPEMLRLPLESIVLQVWAMNSLRSTAGLVEQCARLLSRCPDAPTAQAMAIAQENLTSLQAIDRGAQRLTSLGWHLSRLPCTPRIGRLLVYGCLLNCVFPVTCVAATTTLRSPFMMSNDADTQSKVAAAKDKFSSGGLSSDYNIVVRAMIAFQASADQRKFCVQHGLAFERMLEIKQSMREFMDDLVDMGLLSSVKSGFDVQDRTANSNASRINLLAATYCAGLYPQVAKIIRPPKRFMEVMGGAFERETEAKEMKLYVPRMSEVVDGEPMDMNPFHALKKNVNADFDINTEDLQRVFIHPSSVNFNNSSFQASNYVLFGEKQVVQSAPPANSAYKGDGNKIYLRDTSEVTAYSLLFFGGEMAYHADAGVIVLDNWISFACSQRIADLVKRIRQEFDSLLACKIDDPSKNVSNHTLLITVCDLLDSSEAENR